LVASGTGGIAILMQAPPPPSDANNGFPYVPLNSQASMHTLRRAKGLRALCICEILFALWGTFFLSGFYIILVPIDLIGLFAATRLNTTMMNLFAFLKALCLGFVALVVVDFIYQYSEYHFADAGLIGVLLVGEFLMQSLCLFIAVKVRRDILQAQTTASRPVELNCVADGQIPLHQVPMQVPHQHVPMQVPPQQMPMQVPPQHFQDPHATAGVPGYPYPPQQFFTPMYMNQGYATPYANYPMMMTPNGMPVVPVATYPNFTIPEDLQQPTAETRQ
jgi:hypothetical protein